MGAVPDLYADLPRVRAPRQARSRRAFDAALDAFEELLRDRPVAAVGVQEVADRAGLSITSLYARVDGKSALVLALHERVIAEGLATFEAAEAELDPDTELDQVVRAVVEGAVAFTDRYHHVFRAVAATDDPDVHDRAATFIRAGSERVAELVLPRLPAGSTSDDADVDFAWRTVVAVLQQRWALGTANPGRYRHDGPALVDRLARTFLATILPGADR